MMRAFQLHRDIDTSGVSGLGVVAEGVVFETGKVVISWLTKNSSLGLYDSLEIMDAIHGHNGNTRVVWMDDIKNIPGPKRSLYWEVVIGAAYGTEVLGRVVAEDEDLAYQEALRTYVYASGEFQIKDAISIRPLSMRSLEIVPPYVDRTKP
jgi:hypothetical protein